MDMFNSTSSNDEVIDNVFRSFVFVFIIAYICAEWTLCSGHPDSEGYKLAHESSATEHLCYIILFIACFNSIYFSIFHASPRK